MIGVQCTMYSGLEEAEFEFGFFGHHVFGPFGFEDDGDVHILDAVHRAHFLAYVFDDEVSCRAGWGRERHGDVAYSVVFEFDAVDEAEVVHVHRNLGVKDGFEHFQYSFFFL